MANDRRKKGCPDSNCEMNRKKHKYNSSDKYCIKCGSELVYVCSRCFAKIDDLGPDHKICANCELKDDALKDKVIGFGKKAFVGLGGVALLGIKDEALKEAKKFGTYVVKKGVEVAGHAAKAVLKK